MNSTMQFHNYPAEARIGRANQVYDENDIRQITGTIAVDPKTNKVLVISSSKHRNVWVLPKGGWESDETKEQSAIRETYEEGGVLGNIKGLVGNFMDYDSYGELKGNVWFYEFEVQQILDQWPEMHFRKRRWCTFEEAMDLLRFKPFMRQALLASSFAPKDNTFQSA
ncbi:NUDIX hydrolase domain-like protein [Cokeromyces recurvatus]|uniref:NUDIX hydrolase domain-like protein n=1 Tax=Cokeromyces recurvatus TaxID=90255 RepID=UPI00221EF982|nr:NUDIX hydrolase domain-like protein [Cokeromyces recurvatus]KAI7903621.1 NUDIX hydrolase domain-like protein [Cokeromyces recurvatus]